MRTSTLLIMLAVLATPLAACAQPYYGYGYGAPDPYWGRQREEVRERRREAYWEHRREREEWRRQRDYEVDRNYGR